MLNYVEIKTNQSKVFSRQTDEQRNANLAILNYLDHLAKSSSVNIMTWDIGALFKDTTNKKQSLELMKNRNDINKVFFSELEKIKANPNAELEKIEITLKQSLEKIKFAEKNERSKRLENDIEVNLRYLRDSMSAVTERISRIAKCKSEIAKLSDINLQDKVIQDVLEVLKGNFYEFLEINGSTIMFITKNDIINTFKKPSAGIDLTVNLGQFKITYDLIEFKLKVFPYKNNTVVSSFTHPHVDSPSGSICWGNVSARATELLSNVDLKNALLLLATLLTTYNEEAPYVALATFKQKQDDLLNKTARIRRPFQFFAGDQVRCLKKEFDNDTAGKIYTVDEDIEGQAPRQFFWVTAADDGQRNCFRFENFELVETPRIIVGELNDDDEWEIEENEDDDNNGPNF